MIRSRYLRALFLCVSILTLLIYRGDNPRALSGNVVISQVYGGGGNSGATITNDFIELFNRGTSSVNLTGMSVQYTSSAGTSWAVTALTSVTLAPGQYYLVQESQGAGGTQPLPTPDAIGTIAMSATAGKVALVASTTALAGSCPAGVIDLVGFGGANCFEGSGPTATLSNTTAAARKASGCTETDDNAGDFAVGAPNPRNTTTTAASCGASSTNPSGTIVAAPTSLAIGQIITLTVTVTPGTNPSSTGLGVTGNLGSIGLGTPSFTDQGGNTFTFTGTIPSGVTGGAKSVTATVTDGQGRSSNTPAISVTILAPTSPSGSGSATPSTVAAGGTTQLSVTVSPGANPASTGLSVIGDLTLIGGSNAQVFQSSGGNTFSFAATVDPGTAAGTKVLPVTITDAQGRTGTLRISLKVVALANSTIVISQLYGGGGNTGATYQNDFVQLYNRGTTTVDLSGWSLQYGAATQTIWSGRQPLGGTIAPGQYYLIALASGGAVGAALPAANVSGDINMSATTGKVALVDNYQFLSGACPVGDTHVMDFVGYGSTANCHEGTANAPAPSNTTAIFRNGAGFIDTDDNASDFTAGAPAPLQTAPIVELGPQVLTTDPGINATTAPRDATIEITFTEPVDVHGAWFDIMCTSTGAHSSVTTAANGKDQYITPNDSFAPGETCTVKIFKEQVTDQDTDDSAPNTDTLPADYSWSFSIATGAAPPYTPDVHLTMGNPSGAVADVSQPNNYLMSKPEYALSYNRDLGRPNWVSWHLTPEWFGTLARVDTFRPDPAVPPDWYRVQSFDFQFSGFDRGHMTPNADRDKETSIPINQATYLMSNMVAQAPDNNQGPWANLENYLRSILGPASAPTSEIYIVSGPAGTGGVGSNGSFTTLAGGHVTVPAYTWKVALVLPFGSDDLSRVTCATRTIAVVMPNIQGIRTNDTSDWKTYLTTVDAVETLTGYDFFSTVPQKIQNCIQAGINGVNPEAQEISFAPIGVHHYGDADFAADATASSGLPVTLAVVSGPAAIVNGLIHLTGVGSVTIRATQAGNQDFAKAVPVEQSFDVAKGTPVFSALNAPTIELGSATVTISGNLALGKFIPTGSVAVSVGSSTVNATIGANGGFSANLPASALTVAGSPYTVSLAYAGDANFDGAAANSSVRVVDTVAPVIGGVGATPSNLDVPNHTMVDVTIFYTVTDLASTTCSLSVSSNESVNGVGDGSTSIDWHLIDSRHVQLRAERSGMGGGRIYTIAIRCSDASANSSTSSATVTVPR